MAITNKQRTTMIVVVLVGLLAGGAVLWSGKHDESAGAQGTEEKAGDGHADHGAEKEASEKRASGSSGAASSAQASAAPASQAKEEDHGEERRIKLTPEQLKAANVKLGTAAAGRVQTVNELPGEIRFNEDRTTHVVPRVAGVAEAISADLGQQVRKGQVLAVIASTTVADQRSELLAAQRRQEATRVTFEREKKLWLDKISAEQDYLQAQTNMQEADIAVSNARQKLAAVGASPGASAGLNRFEIRAPFDGTIVEKHLSLGESVAENASIFTIADLSTVWAELVVSPKDLQNVRVGQKAIVSSTAFESRVQGSISYVGALLGEQTRTARARVTLPNPQGAWRPGLFVTIGVLGEEQDAAVTVPADAVQTIEGQPSLFRVVPGGVEAVAVKLGRSDGKSTEIVGGVKAGDQVVTTNSFVLKSELGKSSASHDH